MTQPASTLIDAEIDDEGVKAPRGFNPWWLLAGMFMVGLNLRPALSSVAPVLGNVREGLALSAFATGVLTTLPVLCLGLFAPLAPRLARRWGAERVILAALLVLAGALLLRASGHVLPLFAGTVFAGAAIGIAGVLLPGIVKRDFPQQAGTMTGLYTVALCLGAAVAAGVTEPLRLAMDHWQGALAFWALPALLAALCWAPQLRRADRGGHRQAFRVSSLWRDRLAWQVTGYMGLQSSLAYAVFGWLPTLLIDRGLSPLHAGWMMSLSVLVQLITAQAGPWFATRGRDQRAAIGWMMALTLAGLLGCLYAPLSQLWLWAVLLGLGQGGSFSVALTLLVLRARDQHVAAQLSGMAQGVGYVLASLGPLLVGVLHDATRHPAALGLCFTLLVLAATACGWRAGRQGYVSARTEAL